MREFGLTLCQLGDRVGEIGPTVSMWGIWAPPGLAACVGSWASHILLVLLYFELLCKMKFMRKNRIFVCEKIGL